MISGCTDKNVHATGLPDHLLLDHYQRLKRIVEKNRKDTCFFIKRDRLMNNDAAYRLWERSNENRAIKKSYKFTLIALVITGTGMLMNSILGILGIESHEWGTLKGWVQLLFN